MADYASDIVFTCPSCKIRVGLVVGIPEPDWSQDKAIDRMTSDEVDIECPNCCNIFSAEVTNSDGHVEMVFIEHPETEIEADGGYDRAPDYDDEDQWLLDIPSSPYAVFIESLNDAEKLLAANGNDHVATTMNRMAFVHHFAALEAYFGDTLLNAVKEDSAALLRIVSSVKELLETRLTLAEVIKDRGVVMKAVTAHLKSQMYHNFPKVAVLYRLVLNVNIFPDPNVKARLHKALPLRHDCVHRNGRDKEGNLHKGITREYVSELSQDMRHVIRCVEQALKSKALSNGTLS